MPRATRMQVFRGTSLSYLLGTVPQDALTILPPLTGDAEDYADNATYPRTDAVRKATMLLRPLDARGADEGEAPSARPP